MLAENGQGEDRKEEQDEEGCTKQCECESDM
jgi:hypothetical protein